MLQEIYINNYKCLVNFSLPIQKINLILGGNGSGKSTILEVLSKLQMFITGIDRPLLTKIFPIDTLAKWQIIKLQHFELKVVVQNKLYHYILIIEHNNQKQLCRVKLEQLFVDGNLLFEFDNGTARLFHDDFTKGPEYPFDWTQSGLASLQARSDNQLLTLFKQQISAMVIVQPNPVLMGSESAMEEKFLSRHADNFASWYRFISQENQAGIFELTSALRDIMDGFHSFRLKELGEETKSLQIAFSSENDELIYYKFKELSDGQRMMIVLYTLLFIAKQQGTTTICIDEPENYLALPEIQPWLITLFDICQECDIQAIIISHHPDTINYLGVKSGYWFERSPNSPTRVQPINHDATQGIALSELIARGWIHE